jgi:aerobic carbon-monoxide dehydrogenase medium subunit
MPAGWFRPSTLAEAVAERAVGTTVVGGGAALCSLAFAPRIGSAAIDLEGLGLDQLAPPLIGAMVTIERLVESAELRDGWPAVWEAARATATPEVRRVATLGGTVAAQLVTSDLLTALCASRAAVTVAAVSGTAVLSVPEYLERPLDGIVVEIDLGPPSRGAYRRFANRVGFAPAVAAVAGVRLGSGVHLWVGAVAERPIALRDGALPEEGALRSDVHASAWYRRRLLAVLVDEVTSAIDHDAESEER